MKDICVTIVSSFLLVLTTCVVDLSAQWTSNPIDSCPYLAPRAAPSNVNDLAPQDIKVVMALGDSITAGFGMMGIQGGLNEYRGKSAFIGGDEDNVTLPDFFRHYNAKVDGFSTGQHVFELPGWAYHPEDRCNAAQSDGTSSDLLYQVDHILDVLKNDMNVDMENDWKFMNILIGANDACPLCKRGIKISVSEAGDEYESNLNSAITYVYNNIPRTLVNIVPLFNLSGVYYLGLNKSYCEDFHVAVPVECPCAFDSTEANRQYVDAVATEYRKRAVAISDQWKSMQIPDFTVIYQKYTFNMNIATLPLDFISTLDCFHPSLMGHQSMAINTWNSLLLPLAQKPTNIDVDPQITCPTASSRLWTS